MRIFLDTETAPSQLPDAREQVRATLKPPATMKLQATIDKWWATEADAVCDEQYRKQSFDALHGEIVSIACSDDGDRRWVRCRGQGELEYALINEFFETVEGWCKQDFAALNERDRSAWFPGDDHFLIGHNAPFDIGFLWRRSRVLGVPVPGWLPSPLARPSAYGYTMTLWAGFGGRVSLNNLCRALGVPTSKDGITGAEVFDAWLAGEYERIASYNLADVVATAACWHRLNGGAA